MRQRAAAVAALCDAVVIGVCGQARLCATGVD
jgi:hypothetical protein